MDNINIEISCCLCDQTMHTEIPPNGWIAEYVYDERALCPNHADIQPFIDSQCPGCVGGWGDCDLFRSFAYDKWQIGPSDLESLEQGICPKRTNGTFGCFVEKGMIDMFDMDLRDNPVSSAGLSLAKAITEYMERYK